MLVNCNVLLHTECKTHTALGWTADENRWKNKKNTVYNLSNLRYQNLCNIRNQFCRTLTKITKHVNCHFRPPTSYNTPFNANKFMCFVTGTKQGVQNVMFSSTCWNWKGRKEHHAGWMAISLHVDLESSVKNIYKQKLNLHYFPDNGSRILFISAA